MSKNALRRLALSFLVMASASRLPLWSQSSAGYTVTHVAGADTKDSSGNAATSIHSLPQTDGTSIVFVNGAGTTTCSSAYSLYSVPFGGGSLATLSGPSVQIDPTMPAGTTNSTCAHLSSTGSTLLFGTTYTASSSTHSGAWTIPLAGGTVTKVVATGDTKVLPQPLQAAPGTQGTVTGVNVSVGTLLPASSGAVPSVNFIFQYKNQSNATITADANTVNVYGNLNVLSGSNCPSNGNTTTTTSDLYNEPVYSDGTIVANFLNGTGTNYLGATEAMQFLETSPSPYFGSCGLAVFSPEWGALYAAHTYYLPGEPLPNTAGTYATLRMTGLAVANGNTYIAANQVLSAYLLNDGTTPTYSGIFETIPETMTQQSYYPANNTYTPATDPIPTKIVSSFDAIPGITQGITTCANGGVSQAPAIASTFAANANYVLFEATQTLQNCTSMATTTAGGLYALRLSDKTILTVASIGKSAVSGDAAISSILAPGPGSLSADDHVAFVATYTDPTSGSTYTNLYSAYLDQVSSTLSLSVAANASYGSSLTLTATLANNASAANSTAATGAVSFYDGSTLLGTQNLDATGKATLSVTSLAPGAHNLTATYSGDKLYEGATSAISTVTVAKASTTLALSTSTSTAAAGTSVTLTAQLSSAGGTPTGTVTFSNGATSLGTATLNPTGAATLTLATLPVGTNLISASYGGDANFAGSTSSSTVSVTIGTPDYTISANPTTASITAGQSATFVFTVTPSFGYNQTISFACGNLPANTTCTFTPPTLTPSGPAAVTSTLVVKTSGGSAALDMPSLPGKSSALPKALLCLLGLPVLLWRQHGRRRLAALMLLLVAVTIGSIAGCGGPSTSGPVTPKGTSTVSVTASAGTGSSGTSHAVSITLTVN